MRVLAIDYGSKNIGLAVSDELGLAVRPLPTIRRKRESRRQLVELIVSRAAELEVGCIVIGLPLGADGDAGDAAKRVEDFASELENVSGIKVVRQNEYLTSREAEEMMMEFGLDARQRKARSDEFAAAIILREYLDENSRK